MAYSIQAIKVVILLWVFTSRSESTTIRGDTSIVSDFINYVKPYVKSLKFGPNTIYKKTHEKSAVENVIDDKIQELKLLLQDGDEIGVGDNSQIGDETTIIEFSPRARRIALNGTNDKSEIDSFEKKIRKYQKMRNKIKLALEKESVSSKTKKTVTKTLDGLVAMLVEKQCPWNFASKTSLRSNFLDKFWNKTNTFYDYMHPRNISKELAFKVEEATNILIDELSEAKHNISFNLLNSFNETVVNILKSSEKTPNKYKVRCTLMDMDKQKTKKSLRQKDICDNFRICSEELNNFLNGFYKSLNNTAVSTFRNYASMYATDINDDDSEEKDLVITLIKKISNVVEDRVRRVFIKKISKFKLDGNKNVNANVERIQRFVRNTINSITKNIDKHIETDLSSLRTRLIIAIKDDIHINLSVELGNVETDIIGRVCESFVTCNGKLFGSLRKFDSSENVINGNNVYVKVQLTMDDELKDSLVKNHRKIFNRPKFENFDSFNNKYTSLKNDTNIRATRTTMQIVETTTEINMET